MFHREVSISNQSLGYAFPGNWEAGGGGDPGKACISKANNLCRKWALRREMGKARTHFWEVEDRIWPGTLDWGLQALENPGRPTWLLEKQRPIA